MLVPIRAGSRNRRIVGTAVALVFVFGPPIALAAGAQPSSIDNRAPAPAPKLSQGFDALDAVGPWATDRLAGRGSAVRTKAWIDFNILREMPASGKVLRGQDGYLFLGEDFPAACTRTPAFQRSLTTFMKLAQIIEDSGRNAVFTVGPNKSAVVTENLPDVLPTGDCAANGIGRQSDLLDNFQHPLWFSARSRLAAAQAAGQQPYARTDTHWTTHGGAIYAKALAEHLDPALAAKVTTRPTTYEKTGDLSVLLGLTATESPQSTILSTGTTVTPNPKYAKYDPLKVVYGQERWTTRPATGLVPGKSLLIGDSFTYATLGNLRPLFADGTFMWTGHVTTDAMIEQIKASDTVVIELVQRNVSLGHTFATPAFQAKVAAALSVSAQ
jgi:hypothetical protein